MAELETQTKLKAIAHLVLQFIPRTKTNTVGLAPSDEELTALYENRLDTTRRAQVLAYIANDQEIHERWIRCVETLAYIDELETTQTNTVKNKKNFFRSALEYLTAKPVLSGGFSTAAIIVLVMAILPQQQEINIQLSLNEAYSSWGGSLPTEWDALASDQKPTPTYSSKRSFFDEPKVKSSIQRVLETGFKISLSTIGAAPFKSYGINATNLTPLAYTDVNTIMSTLEYNALLQTGQLAGLAALQCKINSNSPRLNSLSKNLQQLQQQFNALQSVETKALSLTMKSNNNAALCATAQYIVSLITATP